MCVRAPQWLLNCGYPLPKWKHVHTSQMWPGIQTEESLVSGVGAIARRAPCAVNRNQRASNRALQTWSRPVRSIDLWCHWRGLNGLKNYRNALNALAGNTLQLTVSLTPSFLGRRALSSSKWLDTAFFSRKKRGWNQGKQWQNRILV